MRLLIRLEGGPRNLRRPDPRLGHEQVAPRGPHARVELRLAGMPLPTHSLRADLASGTSVPKYMPPVTLLRSIEWYLDPVQIRERGAELCFGHIGGGAYVRVSAVPCRLLRRPLNRCVHDGEARVGAHIPRHKGNDGIVLRLR